MITRQQLEILNLSFELQESMVMYSHTPQTESVWSKSFFSLDEISYKIESQLGIDIKQPGRGKREVSEARHIFTYLSKKFTSYSLKEIGQYSQRCDHSSAIRSISICENLMDVDPVFRMKVKLLCDYFEQKLQKTA